MKRTIVFISIASVLSALIFTSSYCETKRINIPYPDQSIFVNQHPDPIPPDGEAETSIQVAILLDASNSMDGLIEQTKSRLWNIVNTLTTLKYKGKTPAIQIALYMYGNDGLSPDNNYIQQITPFTSDLDLISEKLFSIRTNGGSEYCGAVIQDAVKKLNWDTGSNDMKLIYIAGNEPFNQGRVSYKEAISGALNKTIYVNTIHCGDCGTGINDFWKDGAARGKGKYFCINANEQVNYIETPYDQEIENKNVQLNNTYIQYGSFGNAGYSKQAEQDKNAEYISKSNKAERIVSKSKAIYKNDSWDLVDKTKNDTAYLKRVDKKSLPKEYQNMPDDKLNEAVKAKAAEREKVQKEITELSIKRQEYINIESAKMNTKDDFGQVVKASLLELAKAKGYEVN